MAIAICAAEDIVSMNNVDEESCDSLVKTVVDPRDNNLKNYIVRFDLKTDYAKRNESNEKCFDFVTKLLAKIDFYKEAASLEESNVQKNKRSKSRKNQLKSAFHFKY